MEDAITAKFTPAKIEIIDREAFEKNINDIALANKNRIVTAESVKDDKATRAKLNKLSKSLNDEKIRIKNEYNAPLTEFENWFKKSTGVLKKAIQQIDEGIKEVEAKQLEVRRGIVRAEIEGICKKSEIDYRIFESFVTDWAKSSNFNSAMKLKNTTLDSISYAVEQERLKQEEVKKNKNSITNFAFMSNISDTPYLRMIDEGREISDILEIMNEDILKEKARKEADEKRKAEDDAKAEQERQDLATQQLEENFGIGESTKQIEREEAHEAVTQNTHSDETEKVPEVDFVWKVSIDIEFKNTAEKERWKEVMETYGFENYTVTSGKRYEIK